MFSASPARLPPPAEYVSDGNRSRANRLPEGGATPAPTVRECSAERLRTVDPILVGRERDEGVAAVPDRDPHRGFVGGGGQRIPPSPLRQMTERDETPGQPGV